MAAMCYLVSSVPKRVRPSPVHPSHREHLGYGRTQSKHRMKRIPISMTCGSTVSAPLPLAKGNGLTPANGRQRYACLSTNMVPNIAVSNADVS